MNKEIREALPFALFCLGLALSIPLIFTEGPRAYLYMALMFAGLLASFSFKRGRWIRSVFLFLSRAWLVVLLALCLAKTLAPYALPYMDVGPEIQVNAEPMPASVGANA